MEPLHPAVVHVPLGLAFAAPLFFAGLALALRKAWLPRRSWLLGVALQALLLAGVFVAMETGEDEEERVEEVVRKQIIHEHEERAEALAWGAGITLAVSLSVFVLAERAGAAALATTIAALVTLALAYRTGISGGELVYRHGAASAYVGGECGAGQGGADASAGAAARSLATASPEAGGSPE
jgi:uncharacterized membrane protein